MFLTTYDPEYPDSDDEPIANDTQHFDWIIKIHAGLEYLFSDRPDVLVAADLFWYAVEGRPEARTAPDVMVAFGRPKGHRHFYMQWREGNHPPDVVFEFLTPGSRPLEKHQKLRFYERYGVEEYYICDVHSFECSGLIRENGRLRPISRIDGWISPKLGVRFDLSGPELVVFLPDGRPILTPREIHAEIARIRKETAASELENAAIEQEIARLKQETRESLDHVERTTRTARESGLDPAALLPDGLL